MVVLCQFPTGRKQGEECARCGYRLPRDFAGSLKRYCGNASWKPAPASRVVMEANAKPARTNANRPPAANHTNPRTAPPEVVEHRIAICRECEHYQTGDGRERCGVLVDLGRLGVLMHRRGIPRPGASCPEAKWLAVDAQPLIAQATGETQPSAESPAQPFRPDAAGP